MSIANELITRGWHQGDYEGRDGSVCLYGAVSCVLYGNPFWNTANGEYCSETPEPLRSFLDEKTGHLRAMWNDHPARTFDEVLRVAKEADELLDAL